ncbi:GntR family transcriptional regulator [Bradyrhizobium manausense]|uniref:GntR family transcriptional regulator n=1 Tax=Bradyrhizobium manausense TaxID=989370 RepID=UPI001BAC1B54|nr:GntR family transcriptional regulator [Bradyrhizobium manausense]MBR0834806.1 GntR family transcriptional regulator [Bradyrhizobium manausense]
MVYQDVDPTSDRLVALIRADILAGRFAQDSRVAEEAIASERGVSRTPVRHALRALEQEGLLRRLPRRGYRVRSYLMSEIADAIEVRGELEAMAARIHAEAGWLGDTRRRLAALNDEGTSLIARENLTAEVRLRWAALNLEFHDALVLGTDNVGLIHAYEHLKRMPLVSPRAMVFEKQIGPRTRQQLAAAQFDHDRLIDAIDARKGQRASEIMRDHAVKSGDAKRKNVDGILSQQLILGDLGVALIRYDIALDADHDGGLGPLPSRA